MTDYRFDPIKDKTAEIIDFILSAPEMPTDENLLFKIRLSAEEATENIVQYAYHEGQGYIIVNIDRTPDNVLVIKLRDEGVPFNPLDQDDPDINLSAEERKIGGLGIFLCKQLMDKVVYTFEKGCNILTMEKQL